MLAKLDIGTMDLREVRTDALAADETYSIMMDSHGLIQNQRALRRELCCTRAALVLLLLLCTAVCILGFSQQIPGLKDKEDPPSTNDVQPEVAKVHGDAAPFFASLRVGNFCNFTNKVSGNMIWLKAGAMTGFTLDQDKASLIVPEDGWYKITLQITYGELTSPKKGQKDIMHQLKAYTDAYHDPLILLTVFETVYRDDNWFKSVFSEKVILLQKGYKLKVETNDLSLVLCRTPSETFFTAQLEPLLPI